MSALPTRTAPPLFCAARTPASVVTTSTPSTITIPEYKTLLLIIPNLLRRFYCSRRSPCTLAIAKASSRTSGNLQFQSSRPRQSEDGPLGTALRCPYYTPVILPAKSYDAISSWTVQIGNIVDVGMHSACEPNFRVADVTSKIGANANFYGR